MLLQNQFKDDHNLRNLLHMHMCKYAVRLSVQVKGSLKTVREPKIASNIWEDYFVEVLVAAHRILRNETVESNE